MIAKVETSSVVGIDAFPIEVEVDVATGLPSFSIVGLPDTACRESQDRVRSAVKNSGFMFPTKKVVVNLAPADIKKEGSGFDLPIAMGILLASGQLETEDLRDVVLIGELSLDGRVRRVPGILPRASALTMSEKKFIFPHDNLREASCVEKVDLRPVRFLSEVVHRLNGDPGFDRKWITRWAQRKAPRTKHDFSDVKGQAYARRGMEVAAAGHHNVLMIGPPGAGKTMLAKRMPSILTDLSFEEALETTKIHSVAGELKKTDSLIQHRPFRSPHHTISDIAMVGGGACPRPGEISLAHHGVLFLDELPEFRRNVLEVLRQPLEEGVFLVSRALSSVTFPANFMLVGAMNPCPCGNFMDERKECFCTPLQIKTYMGKVSAPLLDRIDMHLEVSRLTLSDFNRTRKNESSAEIRGRVLGAKARQAKRYGGARMQNAYLEGKDTERYCRATEEAEDFLREAIEELGFSGRAYHKVLKIGRTIADLDDKELVELKHIQEAIHYRSLDRRIWLA